ncbi:LPXTG cell wall anchor domain-containing protein [Streptomyces sp. NPDC004788]
MAAAVTTPVVFLSAAPAFADTKPAAGAEQQAGKSIKDLEIALAAAKAAYDKAVAEYDKAQKAMDDFDKADNPLAVAEAAAKQASKDADAAKVAADQKLADAKKAQADLPADATDEQKAKAAQDVADAQTAADAAKADAEAKATAAAAAHKAYDDAAVALAQNISKTGKAKDAAKKALDEAQKALDEAKSKAQCVEDKNLVTTLTGPKTLTAGSSALFTFRLTNKGKAELHEVGGYAEALSMDVRQDKYIHLAWSSAASPKWQEVGSDSVFSSGAALKPGGSFDFKLKVTVDAKAKAGDGAVAGGAGYVNEDGSCGYSEDGAWSGFTIVKPHKPGTGTGKGDGKGNGSTGGNGNTSQQGGSSNTPVTNGTSGTTGGTLAKTGAGSSTLPIALSGAAAVVLGAGAMVVVRRRKAGADA